jgi:hypothetical protein
MTASRTGVMPNVAFVVAVGNLRAGQPLTWRTHRPRRLCRAEVTLRPKACCRDRYQAHVLGTRDRLRAQPAAAVGAEVRPPVRRGSAAACERPSTRPTRRRSHARRGAKWCALSCDVAVIPRDRRVGAPKPPRRAISPYGCKLYPVSGIGATRCPSTSCSSSAWTRSLDR